tara:strand:+ start:6555 stop:6743 length:189 start_codon:yes stop_codon:yes gene_type:complete
MSLNKEKLVGTLVLQKALAAYLFGSQSTESNHLASDTVVALLFQRGRLPGADQHHLIQYKTL